MNRRNFLGALAAAVVAPWLPKVGTAETDQGRIIREIGQVLSDRRALAWRDLYLHGRWSDPNKYKLYGGARGGGHADELERIQRDYPVQVLDLAGHTMFPVYGESGGLTCKVCAVLYSGDFLGHVKIERPESHTGYIYAWQTFEHEGGVYATVEWDPSALESKDFSDVLRQAAISVTELTGTLRRPPEIKPLPGANHWAGELGSF